MLLSDPLLPMNANDKPTQDPIAVKNRFVAALEHAVHAAATIPSTQLDESHSTLYV